MGPGRPDFAPCCKWGKEILFHYTVSCIKFFKSGTAEKWCLIRSVFQPGFQQCVSVCTSWEADQLHVAVYWAALGYFMKAGRSGRQCYGTERCSFQGKGLWFITMIAGEGWFLQLSAFFFFSWRYKQLIMTVINAVETRSNPRTLPTKSHFPESHVKIVASE